VYKSIVSSRAPNDIGAELAPRRLRVQQPGTGDQTYSSSVSPLNAGPELMPPMRLELIDQLTVPVNLHPRTVRPLGTTVGERCASWVSMKTVDGVACPAR